MRKLIGVRIDDGMIKAMDTIAKKEDLTRADIIRRACRREVGENGH